MSNSDDVSLFERGVDAWNAAIEDRLYTHLGSLRHD